LAKWEEGVERRSRVIKEVGAYTGWDGAVSPDEYAITSERLENARKNFLDIQSKSPAERESFGQGFGHSLMID